MVISICLKFFFFFFKKKKSEEENRRMENRVRYLRGKEQIRHRMRQDIKARERPMISMPTLRGIQTRPGNLKSITKTDDKLSQLVNQMDENEVAMNTNSLLKDDATTRSFVTSTTEDKSSNSSKGHWKKPAVSKQNVKKNDAKTTMSSSSMSSSMSVTSSQHSSREGTPLSTASNPSPKTVRSLKRKKKKKYGGFFKFCGEKRKVIKCPKGNWKFCLFYSFRLLSLHNIPLLYRKHPVRTSYKKKNLVVLTLFS
ncbi:hypothetical protein RFI_00992 [Reticulomyxa filosa]|uniref:Uncharacterized protein n=1 Tax=Reticulomyxa filosa TaxID=46433 RepID=X6PC30_RETFI|nr:hypothetical protein RFI_00992 [Reticulomyxa filosa]|eukprot:ETO36070.1 hypothetical protein RFI_00992 [Reticulomyxa filosa]